ncbi:MAG: toxin [Spirochaetia bacterium]|jgi:hypothetical protein|nr:toxin [Spirochaetia bacterium]
MAFNWNDEKNNYLKSTRGIGFERIVVAIEEGHLLNVLENPDKKKYMDQLILIVEIEKYAFCVPFVSEKSGDFFLKTIYPSRKYTKMFKLKGAKKND